MKKIILSSLLVLTWSMAGAVETKTGTGGTTTTTSKTKMMEPTAEQRSQMAVMHESMAKCLRTNKSMAECRDEMMKNCPMGENCPGMGMWGKTESWGKKRAMRPGEKVESKTESETK